MQLIQEQHTALFDWKKDPRWRMRMGKRGNMFAGLLPAAQRGRGLIRAPRTCTVRFFWSAGTCARCAKRIFNSFTLFSRWNGSFSTPNPLLLKMIICDGFKLAIIWQSIVKWVVCLIMFEDLICWCSFPFLAVSLTVDTKHTSGQSSSDWHRKCIPSSSSVVFWRPLWWSPQPAGGPFWWRGCDQSWRSRGYLPQGGKGA